MKKFFLLISLIGLKFSYASDDGMSRSHERPAPDKPSAALQEQHKEEEKNPQVGVDKGITEANEKDGIKLSTEAEIKFEIQRMKVSSALIEIPKAAIVTAGIEKNIYRYRNGFYRRIDFEVKKQNGEKLIIQSEDLKINDEIVTVGISFIRLAELAAFDGAEGHSH